MNNRIILYLASVVFLNGAHAGQINSRLTNKPDVSVFKLPPSGGIRPSPDTGSGSNLGGSNTGGPINLGGSNTGGPINLGGSNTGGPINTSDASYVDTKVISFTIDELLNSTIQGEFLVNYYEDYKNKNIVFDAKTRELVSTFAILAKIRDQNGVLFEKIMVDFTHSGFNFEKIKMSLPIMLIVEDEMMRGYKLLVNTFDSIKMLNNIYNLKTKYVNVGHFRKDIADTTFLVSNPSSFVVQENTIQGKKYTRRIVGINGIAQYWISEYYTIDKIIKTSPTLTGEIAYQAILTGVAMLKYSDALGHTVIHWDKEKFKYSAAKMLHSMINKLSNTSIKNSMLLNYFKRKQLVLTEYDCVQTLENLSAVLDNKSMYSDTKKLYDVIVQNVEQALIT